MTLTKLGRDKSRQREVVEHRFFGGLSVEQTAEQLSVSLTAVEWHRRVARATLYREVEEAQK